MVDNAHYSFRSPRRMRVALDTGPETITKQSMKDECDIYNILSQFKRTGIINHINQNKPLFTDLPSNLDYQSAMNDLIAAQNAFAALPATVRDYFRNDPQRFLAAFNNESEADKLRELGLLKPKEPPVQAAQTPAE